MEEKGLHPFLNARRYLAIVAVSIDGLQVRGYRAKVGTDGGLIGLKGVGDAGGYGRS